MLQAVSTASGRKDRSKVCKWLIDVEKPKATYDSFKKTKEKWATLDAKLATALGKLFTGGLGRHVNTLESRSLRESYNLLTGRQKLWLMYDFFRTNKDLGLAHSITDLQQVTWKGDNKIEMFKNDWEACVDGLVEDVPENLLANMFLEQIGNSQVLKTKVDKYRAYPKGHRKKT